MIINILLQLGNMDEQVTLINKVLNSNEFQAEGKINEGSYGEIFRVVQLADKRIFAMKALEKTKLEKLRKMHEVAIQTIILKKLAHPGIIRMIKVLEKENYIGIVMELCPYGDLFQLMKTMNKNIELSKKKKKIVVYYLAQILEALSYIHEQHIVHRDLKPQNIVLGEDLRIRIIDFGTAKILSSTILSSQQLQKINNSREMDSASSPRKSLVGSANYLSPEALKLQYSQKSDIWALGVIAYKFYFGYLPFEGVDNMQIFKKIAQNDVKYQENIEEQIQQFFKLTLNKNPNERLDANALKNASIFKGIDFKTIFTAEPPLDKKQLRRESAINDQVSTGKFLFQLSLEKKMFFGNYKPRLLTISKQNKRLMMAYRYVATKKVKNEFQLNLNDFAQSIKNGQFQVVTGDKRYSFRCTKNQNPLEVVEAINTIIRKQYQL